MDETATDLSRLLSHMEYILDSDPQIDEVGFIHPMQFTAFTKEVHSSRPSSSGDGSQLEDKLTTSITARDDSYDSSFWHNGHKLGISTLVLVPLYRAARDAFMDAYKRFVMLSDSSLDTVESEVMKHSRALVLLSCDFATAWNSRKLIVSKKHRFQMFIDELLLSALVLSYSPKSERAWNHRRWVIKMIAGNCANLQEIVGRESELVKTLAENSKMNYRAWNHRCWLVHYMSDSQVLLELHSSRDWAGLHVADNSCFHYRARLLLHMIESSRRNKDPHCLSRAEFHRTLKEELDWVGILIRRYVGREALWLHRRFLSLVWMKQHLTSADDDDQSSISCHFYCTSCEVNVFVKDELMLLHSCLHFPDDDFADYRAQATYAATYVMWLAKQMPMSFGVELRKSSETEGRLKRLLDDAGKRSLWESMIER